MPQAMKKIMIVDDDENIRKTFALLLGKKYKVIAENDPAEALQKYPTARFELVIADMKLPHLTGIEFIGKLRKFGYNGEVMLMTAHPDLVKIEDLSRLSIGHFFVKPLDLNVLDVSIERIFQSKEVPATSN